MLCFTGAVNTILKRGPLLSIGTACVLMAFAMFYATFALKELARMSGQNFENWVSEDVVVVGYQAPFVLWAMPVVLLAGGVTCLVLHARERSADIEALHVG